MDNWREIPEGLLLWRCQGKRDEARDLLTPVYGWFTGGLDTRDLKAKALLDELAACIGLRKSPRGPTSSLTPKLREIRGPRDFSVIPRSEFARELKLKRPPRRTWRLGGCCLSLALQL